MDSRKVKVVVDSTAYIPKEMLNENDISVVSLNVLLDGKSYREVDLENEFFYKKMDESNEIPKSSQPSIEEMKNVLIPIPNIEIQQDIVNIFEAYNTRRDINEKLKAQIKDICPILIKGSIEEARKAKEA